MTLQGGLMSRALTFFPLCREERPPSHCIAQGFPNSGAGLLPGPFVHPLHRGFPQVAVAPPRPSPRLSRFQNVQFYPSQSLRTKDLLAGDGLSLLVEGGASCFKCCSHLALRGTCLRVEHCKSTSSSFFFEGLEVFDKD